MPSLRSPLVSTRPSFGSHGDVGAARGGYPRCLRPVVVTLWAWTVTAPLFGRARMPLPVAPRRDRAGAGHVDLGVRAEGIDAVGIFAGRRDVGGVTVTSPFGALAWMRRRSCPGWRPGRCLRRSHCRRAAWRRCRSSRRFASDVIGGDADVAAARHREDADAGSAQGRDESRLTIEISPTALTSMPRLLAPSVDTVPLEEDGADRIVELDAGAVVAGRARRAARHADVGRRGWRAAVSASFGAWIGGGGGGVPVTWTLMPSDPFPLVVTEVLVMLTAPVSVTA